MAYAIFKFPDMKGLCIALAIVAFGFCASFFPEQAPAIIHSINAMGFTAPVFFLFLYCLATIFFLPTMVMTLIGGAIFGPVIGTIFNLVGATTGAAIAFSISRYWVSDWLHAKQNPMINKLILGVEKKGWLFVAILRIIPIVPFNLVNYGLGLTRIKFSHYVIITFIFLIPVEIISTYCGHAGMGFLINSTLVYKRIFLALVITISLIYLAKNLITHNKTLKSLGK